MPGLIGEPWRPGGHVAALVRQVLFLHNLRSLLPDQRQAVMHDWRAGEAELSREYAPPARALALGASIPSSIPPPRPTGASGPVGDSQPGIPVVGADGHDSLRGSHPSMPHLVQNLAP